MRTAFVSTYPPQRCGIAAFTAELGRVTPDREIVALHPAERLERYGLEVHHQIRAAERDDYARAGRALSNCADVAAVQFDPAIWGGDDGEAVVDFVRALSIPATATLHSIPSDPTQHERQVLVALSDFVAATVALSHAASKLLIETYLLDPRRIHVIPHGVPDLPSEASEPTRASLGLPDGKVVLSFGLLAPGKQLERVIEAMPAVVASHPDTTYVILGATHPDVLRSEGEVYRERLTGMAKHLGVARSVRIVQDFPGRNELTRWIQAADVVVIPEAPDRRTDSATLAYALAAGRAIVTSRSPYAAEMLAGGAGVITRTSAASLAAAVNRLLAAPEVRRKMGALAHERSRAMSWTRVGAMYRDLFERIGGTSPTLTGVASTVRPHGTPVGAH